ALSSTPPCQHGLERSVETLREDRVSLDVGVDDVELPVVLEHEPLEASHPEVVRGIERREPDALGLVSDEVERGVVGGGASLVVQERYQQDDDLEAVPPRESGESLERVPELPEPRLGDVPRQERVAEGGVRGGPVAQEAARETSHLGVVA